jgi:hypothetical protein
MKGRFCSAPLLALIMMCLPSLSKAQTSRAGEPNAPPPYCHPCLFYGGDLGSTGNGVANEMTLLDPFSEVLVPFDVPDGQTWKVIGLFTNDLGPSVIDPKKATWSVSKNVQANDCGTVLASGNSAATYTPTGRGSNGIPEYTVLVKVPPVEIPSGRYWLSVVPECLNTKDSTCGNAQYFASAFEGAGVNAYGPPEPANESFFSSSLFGINCQLVSGLAFSAGVLGASTTAE